MHITFEYWWCQNSTKLNKFHEAKVKAEEQQILYSMIQKELTHSFICSLFAPQNKYKQYFQIAHDKQSPAEDNWDHDSNVFGNVDSYQSG